MAFFHVVVGFSSKKEEIYGVLVERLCNDNLPDQRKGMHKGKHHLCSRRIFTAVSDNTRPALSKTFLGFLVFLRRQSNPYRSIHCVCQIKAAMHAANSFSPMRYIRHLSLT